MKTIPLVVFTISQLTTFIRKHTKKVGQYVLLYSSMNTPLYTCKNQYFSRIRKIQKVSTKKYSCKVAYKLYKQQGYTTYDTSCFMKDNDTEYDDMGNIINPFHSLHKTIRYLTEHDQYDIIFPYKIKVKHNNKFKTYNIFVKDLIHPDQ